MNTKGPKISPRAWALAMQNQIDVSKITPTGPDGRIIEKDVLRELEKKYVAETAETKVGNETVEATTTKEPVEEVTTEEVVEEVTAKEVVEEPVTEEIVEEVATEEIVEEVATEEVVEEVAAKEVVEETAAEEVVEEVAAKEVVEETAKEEVVEEVATEEVVEEPTTEEVVEEVTTKEVVEEPVTEEVFEETAIVTAPVVTIAKEGKKKEEPKENVKEKTYSFGTEAFRHTDVIIPRTEKLPESAPMTITMSFDASSIVRLHQSIKENGEALGLPHITINDMILFASAKLLKKNKILNAHFLGDKIRYFDGVHLGFVVDTGHGMETPTVFDADRLSLSALSKITGALIRGARAGNVSPEKNKLCASFMVTNLGMSGVEGFTPVLTAPQTGSLGVCALQRRIKTVGGTDVSYSCIPLALTFDPRALDTASAAKFLRELCASLENFELLLVK